MNHAWLCRIWDIWHEYVSKLMEGEPYYYYYYYCARWPLTMGVEYLMSVRANMPSPNFCTTCFTLSHSTTGPHLHQCLVFIDPRVDDRSLEACFLKSFFTLVFQLLLKIDQYNSVKSLQGFYNNIVESSWSFPSLNVHTHLI